MKIQVGSRVKREERYQDSSWRSFCQKHNVPPNAFFVVKYLSHSGVGLNFFPQPSQAWSIECFELIPPKKITREDFL